jgi:ankyrin repeat protein
VAHILHLSQRHIIFNTVQHGRTPLHGASEYRQRETCEFLLHRGADVNAKDLVSTHIVFVCLHF